MTSGKNPPQVEGTPEQETWTQLVTPIVARFDTSHVSGMPVSFTAEGAKNMSALLRTMAQKLDYAIKRGLKDEGEENATDNGRGEEA